MSKLDELIQELCPDGVEFVPLWSVTIWDKKFNSVDKKKQLKVISYPYLLAKDMFALEQENGDVFLLSTGEQTGWTTEDIAGDFLCEGEVVSIPWGKSRKVSEVMKYYNGKFVTADNRIATSSDTSILSNKYLYYWMMSQGNLIDSFYRGSGLKHPSMKDVLDMKMPLPPLEVQSEIVRILDNFTELTARKKQYEFYRDKLLTFGDVREEATSDVAWRTLGEICDVRDGTHDSPKPSLTGKYLITSKNVKNGTIDYTGAYLISDKDYEQINVRSKVDTWDILFTMIGTIGEIGMVAHEPDFAIKNVGLIKTGNELLSRFLRHYLVSDKVKAYIDANRSKGTQAFLALGKLRELPVPVVSEPVMKNLVQVLDNFDVICSDLKIGLPAEIEARQKQYEYYRDKLLNFKELKK